MATAAMAAFCALYAYFENGFARSFPVIIAEEPEAGVSTDI